MNYEELYTLAAQVEERLQPVFRGFERTAEKNTKRVLDAFRTHRVSEPCFAGTTGYGYDDLGRETLEKVYADVFGAEAALVRTTFVNGTHAIACALYGALQPGDTILAVTGAPYDTPPSPAPAAARSPRSASGMSSWSLLPTAGRTMPRSRSAYRSFARQRRSFSAAADMRPGARFRSRRSGRSSAQ